MLGQDHRPLMFFAPDYVNEIIGSLFKGIGGGGAWVQKFVLNLHCAYKVLLRKKNMYVWPAKN